MDLNILVERIKKTVDRHKLENTGEYARYLWYREGSIKLSEVNAYGCADAVNILYTINEPCRADEREQHIKVLQSFQDSSTGIFHEGTHHPFHTTAHCIAALELLDAKPLYPLSGFADLLTSKGIADFFEGFDFGKAPWPAAHQGAGIYAAAKLADEADEEWENAYFGWLNQKCNPKTGMWMGEENTAKPIDYMGSGFHYLFNYDYARLPYPYPERLIDSLLDMYNEKSGGKDNNLGYEVRFLEIDWTYSLNRALRQTAGYRRAECIGAMRRLAGEFVDFMYSVDYMTDDAFNDLHLLFGATCALAELQTALPGELKTKKPLRLVLDRRPFI